MKHFIATVLLCAASLFPVTAAEVQTQDVAVKYVSVMAVDGQVLVQTLPRHSITGLACTSNFWATLDKSASGYGELLASMKDALLDTRSIDITVDDDTSGQFCKITRVVLK